VNVKSRILPDKKRLRWILIAFFLALAIPTALLVAKSLDQLKWQTVYQYRGLASDLVASIDSSLIDRARREATRRFDEYGFLLATNNPALQQRSALAAFPVNSEIPGTIGYFQIDGAGRFSSPILPSSSAIDVGITPAQMTQRQALGARVKRILTENELITPADAQLVQRDDSVANGSVAREAKDQRKQKRDTDESDTSIASEKRESQARSDTLGKLSKSSAGSALSESNFDRLSATSPSQVVGAKKNYPRLRRLEELALDQSVDARARRRAPSKPRSKQSEAIQAQAPAAETAAPAPAATAQQNKVTTFERDTDPFTLSRLNSGHFVLYRKAWYEDQRWIQGMLIDADQLLRSVVKPSFSKSSMAPISDLTIAYSGSVLTTYSGPENRADSSLSYSRSGDQVLSGSVLYQSALSAPFNNLQLVFSVNELPTNAGSSLVTWVGLLLGAVLSAGTLGLYKLGKRHIALADQQQDFVAAVSHELKTPLTSIRMYGEMLREGWASEEKKRTYYDYIHDESERLSRLIDNVLQLARMNRKEIAVSASPVAVDQVVDMIRSRTEASVKQAGFTLEITNEAPDVRVMVDIDLLMQVVINLVDNALKFTANTEPRQIDVAVSATDSQVRFSVRDYGPGIPPGQMQKIFKLFYRAENELTRDTVGTGIGLALVNQLVVAMQGRVDVVNMAPGAQFQVFLPRTHDISSP
jgi:signal transduction histidine kinase